jgi:hypothetical protein
MSRISKLTQGSKVTNLCPHSGNDGIHESSNLSVSVGESIPFLQQLSESASDLSFFFFLKVVITQLILGT